MDGNLYKHEFPDFDYELVIPSGWSDESYHNDACPHIMKTVGKRCAEIWEDFANVDLRECSDGPRFLLFLSENVDVCSCEYVTGSDTFSDLLKVAEAFLMIGR